MNPLSLFRVGAVIKARVENAGHEASVWDPKVLQFPLLQQPVQMIMDKVITILTFQFFTLLIYCPEESFDVKSLIRNGEVYRLTSNVSRLKHSLLFDLTASFSSHLEIKLND